MTQVVRFLDWVGILLLGLWGAALLDNACRWFATVALYRTKVVRLTVAMMRFSYLWREYEQFEKREEAFRYSDLEGIKLWFTRTKAVYIMYWFVIVFLEFSGWRYPRLFLITPLLGTVLNFTRKILPPAAVFLSVSDYYLLELAGMDVFPYRMVNLLDKGDNRYWAAWSISTKKCMRNENFNYASYAKRAAILDITRRLYGEDNLRTKSRYNWLEVAHFLAANAHAVVIDARITSPHVATEASLILGSSLREKVVFVVEESGNAPLLTELGLDISSVSCRFVRSSCHLLDFPLLKMLKEQPGNKSILLARLKELDKIESEQDKLRSVLRTKLQELGLKHCSGLGERILSWGTVTWSLLYGIWVVWLLAAWAIN